MTPGDKRADGRRRNDPLSGPAPLSAPRDAMGEMEARRASGAEDPDEPPPVGGSWGRIYAGVILTLVLLILAFWLFTRAYAP